MCDLAAHGGGLKVHIVFCEYQRQGRHFTVGCLFCVYESVTLVCARVFVAFWRKIVEIVSTDRFGLTAQAIMRDCIRALLDLYTPAAAALLPIEKVLTAEGG